MRILLDNCVHVLAKELFAGHEVIHASKMGWAGLSNGDLMGAASEQFDLIVTTDKNMRYQHRLEELALPILELNSRMTRIEDLRRLGPYISRSLAETGRFWFVSVTPDGTIERLAPR